MIVKVVLLFLVIVAGEGRCAFRVLDDGRPMKVDEQPHIVEGSTQCLEYNGKLGCCNLGNDASQVGSYIQIDGIFGSQGGGCDICGINLKRFWCEYACSPNQSNFMTASQEFYPVPDPEKPDEIIMAQKVNLTINADTACTLYDSCSRIGFVTSVSAMGSPAGFLTFQGHNAVDAAFQYIDVFFSYNTNDSIHFNDDRKQTQPERSALNRCNYTTKAKFLHGFEFFENCTCNNCADSCDANSGFIYTESSVFEGFNYGLVAGVWGVTVLVCGILTYYRYSKAKKEKQN